MADFTPDVPEFETLRLLEYGTEQDLRDAAIANAKAAMPEWTPRAGNTEVVLIESLAVLLGPEIMAIQMVGGQLLEQLMGLYGLTRDQGQAATGRARFRVTNSRPTQTIPEGTRLRVGTGVAGETVDLLTTEPLTLIVSETLSGEVSVVADTRGTAPNQIPAGTKLDVVDTLTFIETAELSQALSGGTGPESDVSFTGRAAALLARQTSTLVLPDQFAYAALTRTDVGRARAIDVFNPDKPGVESGGHISVAVAGPDGETLPAETKTEIRTELSEQALASLTIHIIDPNRTTVNLKVKVRKAPLAAADVVKANVTDLITDWINPATWDWEPEITPNMMIARIARASGVAEVLTVPGKISLPGKAPLPKLGTLEVEVV